MIIKAVLGLVLVSIIVISFPQKDINIATASELPKELAKSVENSTKFRIIPNITYLKADNYEIKLDIYQHQSETPRPTLIYFHAGGLLKGEKETALTSFLPYLEGIGFSVVNVEYRLAGVSLAPAAVEDGLCALRWVVDNAEQYNFDPQKIVTTGHSAGGYLALTTGVIPQSVGLDARCPGFTEIKVAAIINWFGPSDLTDLLDGVNQRSYAKAWLGSQLNRQEIAKLVSPINYVRADIPPILTIHGTEDPAVPYQQSLKLHQSLDSMGIPNQLFTIVDGNHGKFTLSEKIAIYKTIYNFLREHQIIQN
ncbi:alpha/beta hydrolase [Gloeocapsa sp. PCC 73106]|uniref:alpha/beta hydrolase n=1 Tax=Gloeocapsa sp. PCC 73106 TaxID=102232 RepID=UPI0002AC19D6|nr:alpha/beta hydrolase [Gloeocapsa sp. PCC 73106]ELR97335.1 esterase/lipase [Gloeocapsa sp. PCC 73106]